jgi:hypothetical protein
MARRNYDEEHMIATAAAIRREIAPLVEQFGTVSMDDFNRARRKIAARAYVAGERTPVMSMQPDHIASLVDLMCQM